MERVHFIGARSCLTVGYVQFIHSLTNYYLSLIGALYTHGGSMKLSSASNTEIPAYELLIELGYSIDRVYSGQPEEYWIATSIENEFIASGLIDLLGLVKLAESKGDKWQASDEQIDNFLSKFD